MSGDSSLVASEYSEPQVTDTKIETQYQPPKTYQEKYLGGLSAYSLPVLLLVR